MKKILLLIPVLMLLLCACAGKGAEPEQASNTASETVNAEPVSVDIFAMDTYMTLTAYGERAEEALQAAEDEIHRIDSLLSTGDPESEISKLNKEKEAVVSEETFGLIQRAIEIGKDAGGVFDISVYPLMRAWGFTDQNYRVPAEEERKALLEHVDSQKIRCIEEEHKIILEDPEMEIDLGGIAKGYTSGRVSQIFTEYGIEHALINLGGNVQTVGAKTDGSLWRVGVQDPLNSEQYVGVISCRDKAVITSGGYQRFFEKDGTTYFHIIDPSDGLPARNGLISATVVADDGTLADALSTTLFILGPDGAAEYWRAHQEAFEMVLIKDDGTVCVSKGLEDVYTQDTAFQVIEP